MDTEDIVKAWVAADCVSALAWAQSIKNDGERQDAMELVLGAIAESDALSAARIAQHSKENDIKYAIGKIAECYAKLDLNGAQEWAATFLDGEIKSCAMSAIARVIDCADGPEAAYEYAIDIPDDGRRCSDITRIMGGWLRDDMRSAMEYIRDNYTRPLSVSEAILDAVVDSILGRLELEKEIQRDSTTETRSEG